MNKYLIFLLTLCLFTFACEQESISPELAIGQNFEIIDRGTPCDLTQIPIYISPAEATQGDLVNFAAVFPVTESTDYESANGSDVIIQQLSYRVNESIIGGQFEYQSNIGYNLVVDVNYSIGNALYVETFSLAFRVAPGQEIEWGNTNFCEYRDTETIDSRGGIASLILP